MDAFFTLIFGLVYNWVLLLAFILALIFKKYRFGIFIFGIIIQCVSIYGTIAGMLREPAIWMTTESIFSIVCFVVLAVGGCFAIKHLEKKK